MLLLLTPPSLKDALALSFSLGPMIGRKTSSVWATEEAASGIEHAPAPEGIRPSELCMIVHGQNMVNEKSVSMCRVK